MIDYAVSTGAATGSTLDLMIPNPARGEEGEERISVLRHPDPLETTKK